MKILRELLPQAYLLQPFLHKDIRGDFIKTYHDHDFHQLGIEFVPREVFLSISKINVLRGMHFQSPPHDHHKLVCCAKGKVLDVLLDLRLGVNYGAVASVELSEDNNYALFIPPGVAHGFLSLVDNSMMLYKTSVVHNPESDKGIKWDSFNFDWGNINPIMSPRDRQHIGFHEFKTPFLK